VEGYREFLLKNCRGQNTAALYFVKLTAVLNQAVREDLLPASPARKVARIRTIQPERRFLTLEELQALASTPCKVPELARAFLFCCYVGLRHSDVLQLTWSQIRDGNLYVRMKKTKDLITIPIATAALAYLPERGMDDERVFHISSRSFTLSMSLRTWAAAAGVAPFTFHTSRHTFATQLLTHGVDIYTVSKLLGHTDLASTQIYARVVDEKKRAAVDMLPAIGKG
jgi:integrase